MNLRDYQLLVSDEYRRRGYVVEAADWGVDFFASRSGERLAVRARMAADRTLLLELEGARRYFDCSAAVLVCCERVLPELELVASRLEIGIERVEAESKALPRFDDLWEEWIVPLQGRTLKNRSGSYQIVKVDASGLERVSSRGHVGFIPIEIFRAAVERLWEVGEITREEIQTLDVGRATSGVDLILAQIPGFECGGHPPTLRWQSDSLAPVPLRAPGGVELDSLEGLRNLGFAGFHSVGELWSNAGAIPPEKGVYVVLWGDSGEPEFLAQGSGGHSKGNPNVPIRTLRSNWVEGRTILYIGKAGGGDTKATLSSRLKQLLDFGRGKPAKHYGGRFLWQLRGCERLLVAWKVLPEEEPALLEGELIRQFVQTYGQLPFANLQD